MHLNIHDFHMSFAARSKPMEILVERNDNILATFREFSNLVKLERNAERIM